MDFSGKYEQYVGVFEDYAGKTFGKLVGNEKLLSAMKYSLLSGGKRVRAVLALSSAELFGVDTSVALPFALAIECIHAYSLIHDDLPALDNDDFRRGKPSNHKVFGEDFAVISGDALLNYAYEILLDNADTPEKLSAARYIAKCAGYSGMIGGQAYDLSSVNAVGEDYLYGIDLGKTCRLIQAPIVAAALISGKDASAYERFGEKLGLLFQFTDDILDEIGEKEKLGKSIGKDKKENKLTAVSVYGVDGARNKVAELSEDCINFLSEVDENGFLTEFVKRLAVRDR